MSDKLAWDTHGEDARVIKGVNRLPPKDCGYFAKLQYSCIDQPVSRLRISEPEKRFSYTLYGHFSFGAALSIAMKLPLARENNDGMRCIVGLIEAADCSARSTDRSTQRVLRVEDEGRSTHKFQTIFTIRDFGTRPCSIHELEGVVFPGEEYVLKAMGVRGKVLAFPGIT